MRESRTGRGATDTSVDLTELESRMLFSAVPLGVLADLAVDPGLAADPGFGLETHDTVLDQAAPGDDAGVTANDNPVVDGQVVGQEVSPSIGVGAEDATLELVIIDSRVEGYESMIADLQQQLGGEVNTAVLVLDASRDGIEQITEFVGGYSDIDSLHLISHGSDGQVQLGNSWLNNETVVEYADQLIQWQASMHADADLVIYGCDVAASSDGLELLESLNALCQCDVAASDDATGHDSLGGDWELEYAQGTIETGLLFSADLQSSWGSILAVAEVISTDETLVHAATADDQVTSAETRGSQQAVSHDANGDYTVAWTASTLDGSGWGVFVQRFNDNGVAITGELLVNETVLDNQQWARVASDDSGNFVVTWTSTNQDGSPQSVYARQFAADGTALTSEFRVNSSTSGTQKNSTIAMDRATGEFVITWQGEGAGDSDGIYFRRYNADGTAKGLEQQANPSDRGLETDAVIAMQTGGNFVIAWDAGSHIYFQRFDSDGNAIGSETQIDGGLSTSSSLAVAADSNGNFTFVYREESFLTGVWRRGYNEDGSQRYGYLRIASGDASSPSIAMADDGSHIVTWSESGDGDDVLAAKFDASGSTVGSTFQVNQTSGGNQNSASITASDADNFIIVWSGNGDQTGHVDNTGVFARQFGTGVINTLPVSDAGSTYVINEGDSLVLDGTASSDSDGAIEHYYWDLDNDGTFGDVTTSTATVSWSDLSSLWGIDDGDVGGRDYTIGLRVVDDAGGSSDSTAQVTVHDVAPTLLTSGSGSAQVGSVYTLNLSASDFGDDAITSWTVNWGDGSVDTFASNLSSVTHVYASEGFTYNVLVSATNGDGTFLQNDLVTPSYNGDSLFRFQANTGELVREFGATDGIDKPVAVIVGPDGNLYVSGETSDDILRYDVETGDFIDVFVAAGSAGLNGAEGIAFGPDGHLYVADYHGDRIMRFDGADGTYIDDFVTVSSGGLKQPYGIVFGPDGNLYVNSYNLDNVLRYDGTTGAFIDEFVVASSGGLDEPEGMAFGNDGNLYVSSLKSDNVLRFDGTTGAFIDEFVSAGSGGLSQPTGLAFGPDGNLYVSDSANDSVLRFDGLSGTFIDEFVASGTGGLTDPALLEFLPGHQVHVTAVVNDAPTLTLPGGAIGFAEDGPAIVIDGAVVVSDSDSANFDGGNLTIELTADGTLNDRLSVRDQGAGAGNIRVSGTDVTFDFGVGATVIGSFIGGTDGLTPLVITLNGNANATAVQALARNIVFNNISEAPDTTSRTVQMTVSDGDGGTSSGQVKTITIAAANDAATVTNLAGDNLVYVEGDGAVVIDEGLVATVEDVDSADFATGNLTVSLIAGSNVLEDQLSIRHEGMSTGQIGVSSGDIFYGGTQIGTAVGGSSGADLVITLNASATPDAVSALIQNVSYENSNTSNPDETTRTVRFTVDDGDGDISLMQDVTIQVSRLNESPTVVSLSNSTVDENTDTSAGYTVGTLSTTDEDALDTSTYSIVGGADGSRFSIAGGDRLVLTDGVLDFETQSSYTVLVRVTDSGGLTHDESITVSVNDLNESPTVVSLSNSTVDENTDTSAGYTVGTLSTTDEDALDTTTYSIVGGADGSRFSITGGDQLVLTDGVLDFETQSSYTVLVRVTDSGGLTHDESITVGVNNLNESPTGISPGSVNIPTGSNTTGGMSVANLSTADPDAAETFTYSILPGADGGQFSIGGLGNDELILDDGVLNAITKNSYTVNVQTVDSFGNAHSETIVVNVTAVGSAPFDISPDTISVDENTDTTGGLALGLLAASDPDASDSFLWSIQPGDDGALFSLGGVDGNELRLDDGVLDFETKPTYRVNIQVIDSGSNIYNETITINVNDVNETPQVTLANQIAFIAEDADTTASSKVADIVVVDDALGTNQLALTGVDAAKFEIIGGTELHLRAGTQLDYETQNALDVSVTVDDASIGATPDGSADQSLAIADVNEAPVAEDDSYSTMAGTDLIVSTGLLANDADPEGAPLSLVVMVNPGNGLLTVNGDGTFSYTPNVGFIGTDTFQYAISDGLSAPISATAEIEVLAVPVPTSDPAAEDDEGEVASEIASDALPVANSGIAIPGTSTSGLATTTTTTTTSSTRGDAIGAIVDNEIVNQLEAGEIQQQTWTRSFYTGLTSSPQAVEATIQVAITQLPYAPSNVAINVLNVLKEEVANESFVSQAVIGTTMFTATSISVGYVIWLIRGGVLLSSVLSSLPAWQMVDPLPVLGYLDEDEDELAGDETETDSSLEKLVAESNTAYDAIAVG